MEFGNVDDYLINIDDFDNWNFIGQGAYGAVYRGKNKNTQEQVAIKVFREKPENMAETITILKEIEHENIVKLLASGKMKEGAAMDRFVLILEFCCYGSLDQYLKKNAPNGLDDDSFLRLLECIISAYKCLQKHKLLHGDIKPGNILVTEDENGKLCFKLADFDTVCETKVGLKWKTKEYKRAGTAAYWHPRIMAMSSESGSVSTESDKAYIDAWAIGVTLYEAATGKRAFQPFKKRNRNNEIKNDLQRAYNLMQIGVISMKEKDNGEWEQSKQLPEGIQMSRELAHIVTPLIAELMNKSKDETKSVDFIMGYVSALQYMKDDQWKLEKEKKEELQLTGDQCLQEFLTPQTDALIKKKIKQTHETFKWEEFSPLLCNAWGEYPLIDWETCEKEVWRNNWKEITTQNWSRDIFFPPLMLPADRGGCMVFLFLRWDDPVFSLSGYLPLTDHNERAPQSISVPMAIELQIKDKVTFTKHDEFKFAKYVEKTFWLISSDIEMDWPMPTVTVKILDRNLANRSERRNIRTKMLLKVPPFKSPTSDMKYTKDNFTWNGLKPLLMEESGSYSLVKLYTIDHQIYTPPLMLPADLGGWMVLLCIKMNPMGLVISGGLLDTEDDESVPPTSISLQMKMELKIDGVIFSKHDIFVFKKTNEGISEALLWLISPDIEANWKCSPLKVALSGLCLNTEHESVRNKALKSSVCRLT